MGMKVEQEREYNMTLAFQGQIYRQDNCNNGYQIKPKQTSCLRLHHHSFVRYKSCIFVS